MIDIKLIRNNPDLCIKKLKSRNFDLNIKDLSNKENERNKLKINLDNLLSKKKYISKLIFKLKNNKKNINNIFENVKKINEKIILIKKKIIILKKYIDNFLSKIPNFISNENLFKDNINDVELYYWGNKKIFNFNIKNYITIGSINNNLDFKSASKLSGKNFVVMKNIIARINRALIQFMLDTHIHKHGYEEIYVPLIVNNNSLYGTGQLPKFSEDIFYLNKFKKNNNYTHALIPTSEVPLVNLVRNKILNESELPLKMVSYTPCFRSESISYGNNSKGLIRLHQFDKVEILQVVKPENSEYTLEILTEHAENIIKLLNLHYRKILLSPKNTSFSSCKTYDLEVWFPYENKYIEVSSCSNTSDFQSRRILARYKDKDKKINLVHIINGSGLAVGRILAAVIENYQDINMNINIPDVLIPYIKK